VSKAATGWYWLVLEREEVEVDGWYPVSGQPCARTKFNLRTWHDVVDHMHHMLTKWGRNVCGWGLQN